MGPSASLNLSTSQPLSRSLMRQVTTIALFLRGVGLVKKVRRQGSLGAVTLVPWAAQVARLVVFFSPRFLVYSCCPPPHPCPLPPPHPLSCDGHWNRPLVAATARRGCRAHLPRVASNSAMLRRSPPLPWLDSSHATRTKVSSPLPPLMNRASYFASPLSRSFFLALSQFIFLSFSSSLSSPLSPPSPPHCLPLRPSFAPARPQCWLCTPLSLFLSLSPRGPYVCAHTSHLTPHTSHSHTHTHTLSLSVCVIVARTPSAAHCG